MTTKRIHGRNLLMNWGAHGANLAVLFFLSPYIIHTLGQVEFGLWSLLTVLTGYLGVLDLGVRASTGRHVAFYLGKGDAKAVDETIRTSLGFFTALGLVVIVAGIGVGLAFPHFFDSVPQKYHVVAQFLVPFMAVNVLLSTVGSIFSSVLAAHDRFDLARGVDLVILALRTAATVAVLALDWGIVGLAVVSVGSNVLGMLGPYYLARRVHSALRIWPLLWSKARLRELLGYGVLAAISSMSVQIIGKTDMVIAGAAIGVSAVAVYSVGAMLVMYSNSFLTRVTKTLFPEIQRSVARGQKGPVIWLFLRATRIETAFGVLAFVGMIMFAEPFIRLWMLGPKFGEESVRQAALVMQILALSKLPLLFVGPSIQVLNSFGRVKLTAALTAAEALLNLALSLTFVLFLDWGLLGIAGGTLAARLVVGTLIAPWQACRSTGANWSSYLVRIGGASVLATISFAAVCLIIRQYVETNSWPKFFQGVGLATLVYPVIALVFLVPSSDRQRLWRWLGLSSASQGGEMSEVADQTK